MNKKSSYRQINPKVTEDTFILREYFPYLARVFYLDVSASVSKIYTEEYNLSVSEWRTMAILGQSERLTAMEIVEQSSMDKVSVSRAVKRMKNTGLLEKEKNKTDGRSSLLCLSKKGKSIYRDLIPKVLDVEEKLLKGMSKDEVKQLCALMDKVRSNALNIKTD